MSAPAEPADSARDCMCAHVFVFICSAIFRPVNVYISCASMCMGLCVKSISLQLMIILNIISLI